MGRTVLEWGISRGREVLSARPTHNALWSGLCGSAALIICQQALWSIGGAASAHSAVHLAVLTGVLLGAATGRSNPARLVPQSVTLAAVLLAAGWLPAIWDMALSLPGMSRIDSPLWNSLATYLVAVPLVILPTALCVAVARSAGTGPGTLAGLAAGIVVCLGEASIIGIELLGIVLAASLLLTALRKGSTEPAAVESEADAELPPGAAWAALVLVAACGGLTVLVERVSHQWSIASLPSLWADAAVLIIGTAIGSAWASRSLEFRSLEFSLQAASGAESRLKPELQRSELQPPLLPAALLAGCGALVCLSGSPEAIQASLWLNSHIEQPYILIAARALLAGVGLIPIGIALGVGLRTATQGSRNVVAAGLAVAIGGCLAEAGFVSLRGIGSSVAITALLLAWSGVVAAIAGTIQGRTSTSTLREHLARQWPSRRSRVALAGLTTLVLVVSLGTSNYDPAEAARTLFTTRVFVAYRSGTNSRLLPYLDDGRLVRMAEGDQGTLTVWKQGGQQLHIRENGVPRGIVSLDPQVTPQFSAEVLQAVFPLVLHERPDRVLVLGAGSGINFTTALDFPLRQCVCAEGNAGLMRIVSDLHRDQALADDRMEVWPVDPTVALRGADQPFDVIISNPGHPALASSQTGFSPQFYQRAASRLDTDGIFCQWLQCIDLGPEPIRNVVQSVQSAFPEVMAVEIAHREFLILGTRSRKGLMRPDLFERTQTAQVRRTMASVGLDWTILLDLPAYRTEDLAAFAAERTGLLAWLPAQPSQLPFAMPIELMSWSPKQEQLQAALARRTGRMVNWLGDVAESPTLLRRLGEVAGQQKLKTSLAEQYWAYRKSLREQVSTNPATRIQQVNGTEGLHDEDRRRINYFKVLSAAVKSHDPADIERLLQFAEPYDPLLSDFVHFEAAELYSRANPRDVERELQHRLHCVFYASPMDTSVQSVIAALKLLREHPEACPETMVRWDLFNSLLQALQVRWEARAGVPPRQSSRALVRDIDVTLTTADATLALMPQLTKDAGLPAETWTFRRQVLEKSLLGPVQAYRTQIRNRAKDVKVTE